MFSLKKKTSSSDYRELTSRSNEALRNEHPIKGFIPDDFVADVAELDLEYHCFDRRSLDVRRELLKISCSKDVTAKPVEVKFVLRNMEPDVPASAQRI
jgi:hypothetical protein